MVSRRTALLIIVLLALILSGCTGEGDPSAGPDAFREAFPGPQIALGLFTLTFLLKIVDLRCGLAARLEEVTCSR